MTPLSRTLVCAALTAAAALAQSVISAKSGMIHYVEGSVFLGDEAVQAKFGSFPEMKENATLRTEQGRAEVLLTPGVFLRLAENSSLRMITNRLVDTRLELLGGSAVIEAAEILKDNSVTVVCKDSTVQLAKKGLYRFDAQPPAVRVFEGEAFVTSAGQTIEVKDGKILTLGGDLAVTKFDKEGTDALDRWSRRRAKDIAMVNLSAANSIRNSGQSWTSSGWLWSPFFGMYTFVPGSGAYYSPYGYRYWSPLAVYRVYERPVFAPPPSMGMGGGHYGYNTMGRTSGGYSGVVASAPAPSVSASRAPASTAAAAPAAPVASSGGGGGAGARK